MPSPSPRTIVTFCAAASASVTCLAANLLGNASFETIGPLGSPVVSNGYGGVGQSAADQWYVFHNTIGTTLTEIVPSAIQPNGKMIHVKTDGVNNGIEHVFGAFGTGPACVNEGIWLLVVNGDVLIGAGNGGQTGADTIVSASPSWQFVQATNTYCPANVFIVFAASFGGAEFYAELASVEAFPCTGPPGDIDNNGLVDGADLGLLLSAWNTTCGGCPADLDGNGFIDGADLGVVLANWGCG